MNKNLGLFLLLFLNFAFAKAQLSFCSGQSGDPIFIETFGNGLINGPPLPVGVTTYSFLNFAPNDGEYTITSNTGQRPGWWFTGDHTGDVNGKMLLVNASFNPGLFYQTPITRLCENTPYEFSTWILNILRNSGNSCNGNEVPIEVRFEIWDDTDTVLLASGAMAPRFSEAFVNWVQYGLTFTTSPGQNGVILKMINQGRGGCGNDLAIDDIAFKTCGDETVITAANGDLSFVQCEGAAPLSFTLNAETATTVFASPAYQWQVSTDGTTFTDVTGETTATFTTGLLTGNTFYRVKVAEDAINLNNSQCINFSSNWRFTIENINVPAASQSTVISCGNAPGNLAVTVQNGEDVTWYATPVGGTVLGTGTTFVTNAPGTYYAEAVSNTSVCRSLSRTPITFSQIEPPTAISENLEICPGTSILLDSRVVGAMYFWNTGETSQAITINASGTYTCIVTNDAGCESTSTFIVTTVPVPVIESLNLVGEELTVMLANSGNFSFSIDGFTYQNSPTFLISGLLEVVVRVRNNDGCEITREIFRRIDIPLFFTPNNDGFHDRWEIYGIENFPGSKLEIYDRYGKLLASIREAVTGRDGLYNNQPQPSADYWYKLTYDGQIVTGHFSLKR